MYGYCLLFVFQGIRCPSLFSSCTTNTISSHICSLNLFPLHIFFFLSDLQSLLTGSFPHHTINISKSSSPKTHKCIPSIHPAPPKNSRFLFFPIGSSQKRLCTDSYKSLSSAHHALTLSNLESTIKLKLRMLP